MEGSDQSNQIKACELYSYVSLCAFFDLVIRICVIVVSGCEEVIYEAVL